MSSTVLCGSVSGKAERFLYAQSTYVSSASGSSYELLMHLHTSGQIRAPEANAKESKNMMDDFFMVISKELFHGS